MIDLKMMQEMLTQVCVRDAEEITGDMLLVEDLEMDSFSSMEFALDLEKKFDISIADADLKYFRTVNDVISYLEQKIQSKQDGILVAE